VAVGVLDMAVWDATAKIAGVPLFRLLADRYRDGITESKVFVYAAGGYYYPGKDLNGLRDEMAGYLDLGYSVVKMKIGGAPLSEDLARIEAVLKILKTPDQLAVDANGRFDVQTEPGDPLDYELLARLARIMARPWQRARTCFQCRMRAI
jgi:D(-)-tartrate dehydratase